MTVTMILQLHSVYHYTIACTTWGSGKLFVTRSRWGFDGSLGE